MDQSTFEEAARQVRKIAAECFGNPVRQAARLARAQYIGELFAANLGGDDVDREARDWLARPQVLCAAHCHVIDIKRWYENESARLARPIG
jgi:hypothetical protein